MPDVILSTKTYDLDGFLEITLEGSREALLERTRRAVVTPTLDGGVAVQDGGFTHGDRTIDVRMQPTRTELTTLTYLIETYSQLNCSLRDGFYTAVPQRLSAPAPVMAQLRLLLISKDSA
jgi:hypothetical protein